jgi:hypothetical protein
VAGAAHLDSGHLDVHLDHLEKASGRSIWTIWRKNLDMSIILSILLIPLCFGIWNDKR